MEHFQKLNSVNVNDYTEKKSNLTYLSWSNAWEELKKLYPDATYEIERFDGKPYLYDENTGYMVFTKLTIEGLTHEMWLPVMDFRNNAMKAVPYECGKSTVQPATMTDINKAIMRCLTKNIAMFGLGLYIYKGEDLPAEEQAEIEKAKKAPIDKAKKTVLLKEMERTGVSEKVLFYNIKVNSWDEITTVDFNRAMELFKKQPDRK